LLILLALSASAAVGVGAGVLVSQMTETGDERRDVRSITGVSSGTDGTTAKEPEKKSEIFTTDAGAMQSIRGIKGIDTVMLQNLEAVLRMQAPPPPPEGGGRSVRTAAALLTMADDAPAGPEVETDDRQELSEFELEGS
jgi:hypothetical protein